jgi:hypothetical protein
MVEAAVQEEGFTVVATTQVRGGRGGDADREARGGGVVGGGEGRKRLGLVGSREEGDRSK